MKTKVVILALLSGMLATSGLLAQSDTVATSATAPSATKKLIHYTNNLMFGALFGKNGYGTYISLNTTHGVRYGRWTAGIGTGYDVYKDWNTLPVFGSVSYDFAHSGEHTFFAQLNGGYAWAFYSVTDYTNMDSKGGRMFNPMVGYRFKISDKVRLYLSAGYKFQRINYEFTPNVFYMYDWVPGATYVTPVTKVQRDMDRVVVQIGLGLF